MIKTANQRRSNSQQTNSHAKPAKPLIGLNGAQILNEVLIEEGVEHLFGYPGGVVIPIFNVLYDSPIKTILTRHEQGAAHMADGYARSSGRVGVCLATSGPGATNLVTGLATANMDSSPVVAITGQVRSSAIGSDAFQEADVTGITRPVTKRNRLVRKVEEIAPAVREAFYLARTGRPGPVLVDICVDATLEKAQEEPSREMRLGGYNPNPVVLDEQIMHIAAAINAASRPILYAGGGIITAGATEALRAIIDRGRIPVTTTLLGLGCVDEQHELALRMLGMHGSVAANTAIQNCDCLIAVGARFDDRVTGKIAAFAPHAKIIHIDIDPASISKTVRGHLSVVGDARDVLERLAPHITPNPERDQWLRDVQAWKSANPFSYGPATEGKIRPQRVIETLGKLTNHDAIVCTGVGQHQMFAAQFYGFHRPRQFISSGGLGTMGFGVPSAVGASFANPAATVIDIDGDGSFSMTMQEVITAVRYQRPVKFVVLDNTFLGMVRQWQEMFWNRRYSSVHSPAVDFVKVAEGFGATGMTVSAECELEDAMVKMLKTDGPVVMQVKTTQEENVYPMVPNGKALHEMTLGAE